jgi:hypothetical protein
MLEATVFRLREALTGRKETSEVHVTLNKMDNSLDKRVNHYRVQQEAHPSQAQYTQVCGSSAWSWYLSWWLWRCKLL